MKEKKQMKKKEGNLELLIDQIINEIEGMKKKIGSEYKEGKRIGEITEIIGKNIGVVSTISDGIITIKGLQEIVFGEMIEIIIPGEENIIGIILNIEKKKK